MKSVRPLADPRLEALLADLLAEESLPPLDRWFSQKARQAGWPAPVQKGLWEDLRRALSRAYGLLPAATTPEQTGWDGVRRALRGRTAEWAVRARLGEASAPTLAMAGVPGWLAPAWEDRCRRSGWGSEQQKRFLGAQDTPAPVHVRFRASPEGAAARDDLARTGRSAPSDVEGIDRLTGGPGLETTSAWKNGLVDIQDASSQLSLKALELRPGQRVWDLCAGTGGKTLSAAAELRGKGAILATEVTEHKLKGLKERVRRSGRQNIRLQLWDGKTLPDFGPEVTSRGGFDRVILDAPCTATGTWRRDPEARFRLSPRLVRDLADRQARLLRLGWASLKRGGRLVYITCSWLPIEDEEVTEAFSQEEKVVPVHQELLGLPAFDANTLYTCVWTKP